MGNWELKHVKEGPCTCNTDNNSDMYTKLVFRSDSETTSNTPMTVPDDEEDDADVPLVSLAGVPRRMSDDLFQSGIMGDWQCFGVSSGGKGWFTSAGLIAPGRLLANELSVFAGVAPAAKGCFVARARGAGGGGIRVAANVPDSLEFRTRNGSRSAQSA